jgi:hypothetical protein
MSDLPHCTNCDVLREQRNAWRDYAVAQQELRAVQRRIVAATLGECVEARRREDEARDRLIELGLL